MKKFLRLNLFLLFLAIAAGPVAANPPPVKNKPRPERKEKPKENAAAEMDLLEQAYRNLFHADHDYHGHRIAAMGHIAGAVRLLGGEAGGDGGAGERQGVSDDQLRRAEGLLQQALRGLVAKRRPRAVQQVQSALRELHIALNIA